MTSVNPSENSAEPSPLLGQDLAKKLAQVERRRRGRALLLVLPLFVFLLIIILIPLVSLLKRAVENPEVVTSLPQTTSSLRSWDRHSNLPDAAFAALFEDLQNIPETARAGELARRLNAEHNGFRSLIMGTYRALQKEDKTTPNPIEARSQLMALDERWGEIEYWQTIAKNSSPWSATYLLTAVDLKINNEGEIVRVDPGSAAFSAILWRTFNISFVVAVLCLLLGYPLSYWLTTLPSRQANLMLILVLLPFWTSVLVRIAAWIVLLQNNGLINRFLQNFGVIDHPLPLLFNRVGVIIALVHILLPFTVLPLFSVMKTVPVNYLRAAISLGSSPLAGFFRVYVPQTYPGVAAGGLLVFITCIGYYVTPALLGGASDQMMSYYVAQYTNVDVNWGMASALGAVLLLSTTVLYLFYRKVSRSELSLG